MIKVIGRNELRKNHDLSKGYITIDCTPKGWNKELAPNQLGPVECYDGLVAKSVQAAFQFSKVYASLNKDGEPSMYYSSWRDSGFSLNNVSNLSKTKKEKPLYHYWKIGESYRKLNFIEARRTIFIPLYAKEVVKTEAFAKLKEIASEQNLMLVDYDAYDYEALGMTLKDVIENPKKEPSHAFILKMLLDGTISVEDEEVIFSDELN